MQVHEHARARTRFLLLSMILSVFALLASPAAAQFPLGLPGTSSDQSDISDSGDASGSAASTDGAVQTDASAQTAAAPQATATEQLLQILRDDTARQALIAELEAAQAASQNNTSGDTAPVAGDQTIPDANPQPVAQDAQAEEGEQTFGVRAGHITREFAVAVRDYAESVWARVQRIPRTFELATRAFEREGIVIVLQGLFWVVVAAYATLWILNLGLWPLRSRLNRRATGKAWLPTLGMRIGATVLDFIPVPLASLAGIAAVVASTGTENEVSLLVSAFMNGFVAVEVTKVIVRFVLSPRTAGLRLIPLADGAALSLWRISVVVIMALGYGQLTIVPLVNADQSIFVGRAVSTLLGALVVIYLICVVLVKRRPVSAWLRADRKPEPVPAEVDVENAPPSQLDARYEEPDAMAEAAEEKAARGDGVSEAQEIAAATEEAGTETATRAADSRLLGWLANRWHWPALIYLFYVLAVVLTRPGNVLLPLLWATGQIIVTVIVGMMVSTAVTRTMSRRIRLPESLNDKLPLLETRINGMVPKILMVLRIAVVLAVLLVVLSILGIVDWDGYMASPYGAQLNGRLAGAGLSVLVVALIWLAMSSWVDYRLNPFFGSVPTPRERTLLTLMRNAVTIALVVIGLMFSLAQLGMNIGPLLASAGVLGLALSFGAQKLVEDIITGIFIQFENAMNVGDVVSVNGVAGVVEKLTVRSVTLRDLGGAVHMIPFSSASMVTNFMREFSYYVCDMGVAYRESIEDVKQAMLDGFEELRADEEHGPTILDDLEWFGLNSFGDSALVVRARIKTVPGKHWGVGRAYNGILKRIFDERGIEIPFPHQTIYFGEDRSGKAPPMHISLDNAVDLRGDETAPPQLDPPKPAESEQPTLRPADMPDADEGPDGDR